MSQDYSDEEPREISAPTDVRRVVSVRWNEETSRFEGVPQAWAHVIPQGVVTLQPANDMPPGLVPLALRARSGSQTTMDHDDTSARDSAQSTLEHPTERRTSVGAEKAGLRGANSVTEDECKLAGSDTNHPYHSLSKARNSLAHLDISEGSTIQSGYGRSPVASPTSEDEQKASSGIGAPRTSVVVSPPPMRHYRTLSLGRLNPNDMISVREFMRSIGFYDLSKHYPVQYLRDLITERITMVSTRKGFYALPIQVKLQICSYLDLQSLINLGKTCTEMRKLVREPVFWLRSVRSALRAQKTTILASPAWVHDSVCEAPFIGSRPGRHPYICPVCCPPAPSPRGQAAVGQSSEAKSQHTQDMTSSARSPGTQHMQTSDSIFGLTPASLYDWREVYRGLVRAKFNPMEFDDTFHVCVTGHSNLRQAFAETQRSRIWGVFVPADQSYNITGPRLDSTSSLQIQSQFSIDPTTHRSPSHHIATPCPRRILFKLPESARSGTDFFIRRVCFRRVIARTFLWLIPPLVEQLKSADMVIALVNVDVDSAEPQAIVDAIARAKGVFGDQRGGNVIPDPPVPPPSVDSAFKSHYRGTTDQVVVVFGCRSVNRVPKVPLSTAKLLCNINNAAYVEVDLSHPDSIEIALGEAFALLFDQSVASPLPPVSVPFTRVLPSPVIVPRDSESNLED